MKLCKLGFILLVALLNSLTIHHLAWSKEAPGQWEKVNEKTLRFWGQIDKKTAAAFYKIITPKITTIIVNSGGGEVENALLVGREIYKRQLNIIVDGRCGSSCANYWFVAATNKTVRRGSWVGFHGNPSSSLPYYDIRKFDQKFLDDLANFEQQEIAFFNALEVDIELVQRSSTITVAFKRSAYLPSPEQLDCFGVTNLYMWYPRSSQDKDLLWGTSGDVVLTQEVAVQPQLASVLCNIKSHSSPKNYHPNLNLDTRKY